MAREAVIPYPMESLEGDPLAPAGKKNALR